MNMGKAIASIIVIALIGGVALLFAQQHVRNVLDQFPPEQTFLQSTSPDGTTLARFSVKHQSICRWLSDIEPHYYLTTIDLESGRMKHRSEKFLSFNMRENFLALAREQAPWCVAQIENNKVPSLNIEESRHPTTGLSVPETRDRRLKRE
jgi:hypothetical protein